VGSYLVEAKNPYEILKIKPNATQAEIKVAFRKIALGAHPDETGSTEKTGCFPRCNQFKKRKNSMGDRQLLF
jgi:curved DNA-binding protein CbpA